MSDQAIQTDINPTDQFVMTAQGIPMSMDTIRQIAQHGSNILAMSYGPKVFDAVLAERAAEPA